MTLAETKKSAKCLRSNACVQEGGGMQDDEIDDIEIFEDDIKWSMITTKNLCRVTLVAKAETPINSLKLYLSLSAQLERWRVELGIMEDAPEVM